MLARGWQGYDPRRMVPPMAVTERWSGMMWTTGCGVSGSSSDEFAPARPIMLRAHSITITWRPRHKPRYGTWRSLA